MRVFVNFRREITDRAVADRFKALLLGSRAFDDVMMSPEDPAARADDGAQAAAAIAQCDAFIAIIGPGWATWRDAQGRSIDDPRDPVRLEITSALDRIMPMVPVLLDGATLPDASAITPALQGLTLRDSVAVDLSSLKADFPRLLAVIAPGFTSAAMDPGTDTRASGQKPSKSQSSAGLPAAAPLQVGGATGFRALLLGQRTPGAKDEPWSSTTAAAKDRAPPPAVSPVEQVQPPRAGLEAADVTRQPTRADLRSSAFADNRTGLPTPVALSPTSRHRWMLFGVVALGIVAVWVCIAVMSAQLATLRDLVMSGL